MRLRTLPPESARIITICDGYQLCRGCGLPLVNGDRVLAASRSSDWLVFSHLNCAPRAWAAIKRVEWLRQEINHPHFDCHDFDLEPRFANNKLIPRSAFTAFLSPQEASNVVHCEIHFPFVSLLDRKHVEAELSLVTVCSRESQPYPNTLNSRNESNETDTTASKCKTVAHVHDSNSDEYEAGYAGSGAVPVVRIVIDNFVEKELVARLKLQGPYSVIISLLGKCTHGTGDSARAPEGGNRFRLYGPRPPNLSKARNTRSKEPFCQNHTYRWQNNPSEQRCDLVCPTCGHALETTPLLGAPPDQTPTAVVPRSQERCAGFYRVDVENRRLRSTFEADSLNGRPTRGLVPWSCRTQPSLYEPILRKESKANLERLVEGTYRRPMRLCPAIDRMARGYLAGQRLERESCTETVQTTLGFQRDGRKGVLVPQ